MYRVGNGFDIHQFIKDKKLILGGIEIDFDMGLKAHSDGDVLIHSIIDSLLGAVGDDDIGSLFPDNDIKYKDISSTVLLNEVLKRIYDKGYIIVNIDCTIVCERPKIKPYRLNIKKNLAEICHLNENQINIKGKTMEKLGDIGEGKGIMAFSTCLIKEKE